MESFENKIAVVTGGGTGMGRELVCQLIAAGAHVAMCDVSQENMDETRRLAAAGGPTPPVAASDPGKPEAIQPG